ncbi:MAG: prolipoprotein diacylglyceryl transferase [Polyangiaceae bacterium]|nr:prolipoprotein diacylglyceryl transferase [Polyangiaceae bacterium]
MTWSITPYFLLPDGTQVRYYSILALVAMVTAFALIRAQLRRLAAPVEEPGDFFIVCFLSTIIGARLGHMVFYDLDVLIDRPHYLFQIWRGGLSSHGALLGLFLGCRLISLRRGLPLFQSIDLLPLPLLLAGFWIRIGNFFNSEIVGRVTTSSWGVRFPRYDAAVMEVPLRYPVQLMDAVFCLALFLGLLLVKKKPLFTKVGMLSGVSLFLYSIGRFHIEFFKEYQTLPIGSLTMGQYLSVLTLAGAIVIIAISYRRQRASTWVVSIASPSAANAKAMTT